MTRRVAVASITVVCVVMLLVGGAAYLRFAHDLQVEDDSRLAALASHPGALLARPGGAFAQVRGPAGAIRAITPALKSLGTIPPEPAGYANVTVGARPLRVLTRLNARGESVSVAVDRTPTLRTVTKLRRELLFGSLAGALLAALALVVVTRRALAPVRAVAELADRVARTNDLRTRVPEVGGDDELARLTSSINRMLDRLEVSDEALRRLVGDASHELRTPITSLRGNLELLASDAAITEEDRASAVRDAYGEAQALQRLVEDLLALARADEVTELESMPVSALTEGLASDRVTIDPGLSGASLAGDLPSLRAMVRNMIDNAERYAGSWELAIERSADAVELRVIDHGPGVPPAEQTAIFARFARGSTAAGTSGSGIGLALVDAVARSHGGKVAIEETPGGGATFVVRLPLGTAAPPILSQRTHRP